MILEHIRYTRLTLPRRSMCPLAWTPHRKARSSNFSVKTGTYLRGVQPTCQVFPGNSPSTLSNCSPIPNHSSRSRPATRSRLHQGNQEITIGSQPRTRREEEHRHTSDVRRLYRTQQMLPKGSLPATTNRPDRRLNRRMRSTVFSRRILGLSPDTDEGRG